MELLNDQGLRIDGRRANELRLIRCKLGIYSHTDGSAYLEQGNTKVIAAVYGPREMRSSRKSKVLHDSAYLNCQYSMTTFSTTERRNRNRGDKKTTEMTINLHQALSSVIRLELMARSEINVYVEILQADGGNYSAAVNAATLALIDAGIPLREYVIACTASLANGNVPMVDISHLEENIGGPTLTVAMLPLSKQIALMEMSQRFHVSFLEDVLKQAQKGCEDIYNILDTAVRLYLTEIGKPNSYGQG